MSQLGQQYPLHQDIDQAVLTDHPLVQHNPMAMQDDHNNLPPPLYDENHNPNILPHNSNFENLNYGAPNEINSLQKLHEQQNLGLNDTTRQGPELPLVQNQSDNPFLSSLKSKLQAISLSNSVASLQRSYLFTNNDRYTQEQQIMLPLKSGGGLLGTTRIILDEKLQQLNIDKSKYIPDSQMLSKLRIDGVYVNDPQTHQKFTDINVQKLEERLLREKKTNYFKMNGELKLDNDLLADEITRPADLAFEQTEAFQMKEVNATLSNRLHSFKKRYYRLDIVVGKISLLKYPQFFTAEDKLALELNELYKEYEKRTSLAMIPFYMGRLEFIKNEQYLKSKMPHVPQDEIDFLQKNIDETQRQLDSEKKEVQDLATVVYNKWKEIKIIRQTNQYSCSNVKLKVYKTNEGQEFYFNLMHEEPSGKRYNGTALPGSEVSRRNNAMKIRAYVRLIINGKYVSRTRKAFLNWPNFEIEISEQFQVMLFTMPSSIQLELVIGTFKEVLVDVIDVEVPGQYVKALTSASSLVKEIQFSKYIYEQKRMAKKLQTKKQLNITEEQKKKQEEEQKRKDVQTAKAISSDIQGLIYLKTEWKGEGPDMPPMRTENLFKSEQVSKLRKNYTEEEQNRMLMRQLYIDVNDPRNERIIKFIKETKNEFLIQLLKEDAKNPLSSLQPFRHKLLQARTKDPALARLPIPLLEKEIINSQELLNYLEVLYREQAYREYLEKRAELDKQTKAESDPRQLELAEFLQFDTESIRRRQKFFDLLKQKQKEIKAGHQRMSTQYKSVISEFELLEAQNPLVAIFNKMFITGRKLRPLIKDRQAIALDTCKDAKIMVHVIKGYHVPVRSQVFGQINRLKMAAQAKGGMSPYGGNQPGPTPRLPSQLMNPAMMQSQMFGSGFQQNQMDQMRASAMGQGFGGGQSQYLGMNQLGSTQFGQYGGGSQMFQGGMGQFGPSSFQPVNIGGNMEEMNKKAIKDLYRITRVETFVEIRIVYHEGYTHTLQTNIADGDFPEWNEVLSFPLQAENGKRFTKEELMNSKTQLYISLFDQEITPYKEDDYNSVIKMQIEYRFLGSFTIPLSSILNNPPKMEAMFKVNRPLALFNYTILKNNIFLMDAEEMKENMSRTNEEINTYISLSISLDPILEVLKENQYEYFPGAESSQMLIACNDWIKTLKSKKSFENREFQLLGENINGQSILLCRFLTEQAPPDDVCDLQSFKTDAFAIEKVARYVSLIPYIDDNKAFQEMPDLFCTSQEFLDLGAGDFEEHAILLCNYFNYIDKLQTQSRIKSYIAIGRGNPEGKTCYVLRRDTQTNHVELWNPMRGEAYFFGKQEMIDKVYCIPVGKGHSMSVRLNDPTCQLKSIGCIIGQENIWANIQHFDDPAIISYKLDDTKCWQPFFSKNNFVKYFPEGEIMTIQPPLIYSHSQYNNDELAIRIQKFISQKFQEERISEVKMTTKWNVAVGDKLTNILFHCEIHKLKSRQGATNSTLLNDQRRNGNEDLDVGAIANKIRSLTEVDAFGKRTWGFPINMSFVTLDLLWEEVKNTKLHAIQDRNAEFSLSVYVKSYSSNVLSVWLYLAVFTKQRINN